MNTAEDPDIVHLYTKIRNNPDYLEVPNEMPFVESTLHTAASEGRTSLALEILRLKPSLGKKLNLDGLSPLHKALDKGHTNTVKQLVKHDPGLVRVPGREGITLLHYAVKKEEIDLLIYFLLVCPHSIHDLTVRDETAAHIAVRNNNFRAFLVLFGWAGKTNSKEVFSWKNKEGNTLMHLAALANQPQVMKSLIGYEHVNKKNLEGKTALDILNPENVEARKILISAGAKEGAYLDGNATSCENYLKSNRTLKDFFIEFGAYLEFGLSGNMQNAVLVVVVLIATAAFEATFTSPFGISHNDTTLVFPSITSAYNDINSTSSTSTNFNKKTLRLAEVSMIYNTIAFGLAMGTCAILTFAPLCLFLLPCLVLFSISHSALAWGIYPGAGAPFIPCAVAVLIILPTLIIVPWKIIQFKLKVIENICYEYNLDEVKYLTFGSRFITQGLILTRRKALR
ncbi:ankyrin repeat-containing protein BDA1-like [Olea europaea var. sylvestris]|uniref:ankyrin repeat-containing protein BDA1-like n=1 Tax=Olea europaea var. sylvestris TaxID=158386 RepID=UPI000C1D8C8C|nr:ankyrin repeat-containing protein BDA1-like [Olea europaea var. sylvestris]